MLEDISLTLGKGAITTIMGHNGAGKTLLLSALHGLTTIQTGTINAHPAQAQKMVFQTPILMRRSAQAHFSFASGITDPAICATWFERAKLQHKMTTPARQLSAGEAQKLAMIAALATAPDVLFVDEPTANLDAESTADIEALLHDACDSGASILLVTHSLAQAKRLSHHMLFMHKGRLVDNKSATAFFSGNRSQEADHFLATR